MKTGIVRILVVKEEEREGDEVFETLEICDGAINTPEIRVRNSQGNLKGSKRCGNGDYLAFRDECWVLAG